MHLIESLEQWNTLSAKLSENGYRIWQMQFNTKAPEGFQACFFKTGKRDFGIVTYCDEVYDAIIRYK